MVSGSDYGGINLLDNSYFDTLGEETKNFVFNTNGIAILQNWLDVSGDNQGFAFAHADKSWVVIYSKESIVSGRRPQLFVTYALDTDNPEIDSLSPLDEQTGVALDSELLIDFNERIHAITGYFLSIRRSSDDSLLESINVGSSQVELNDSHVKVLLTT
ncbi:MAG: Ig-like domain-containing protein [bacterium]|nr:Ig-like domain-containing protein [bacterium]